MKPFLVFGIYLYAVSIASGQTDNDPLSEQMVGDWVLRGTLAGKETVHDVHAQWVLNREYVELHEVSREKNASGTPSYEAIIYIAWDSKAGEYACLWLDSTEGGALSPEGIQRLGRAKPEGNKIPFVFKINAAENIRNTFIYEKTTDTWDWTIENEKTGKVEPFAKLHLTKAR